MQIGGFVWIEFPESFSLFSIYADYVTNETESVG